MTCDNDFNCTRYIICTYKLETCVHIQTLLFNEVKISGEANGSAKW